MEELNLATLPKYLSDEHEAWALLERLRWPDGEPVCPHCGTQDAKHYFISSKSGERRTRTGNITYRRLWRCRNKDCRKQFSVLVGTIFESSKVPASKWLLALWLMSAAKNGVSALELERHLKVAHQTAWFIGHRLREAMGRQPLMPLLVGTVVADETWVGGKPKNRHQQGRQRPGTSKGFAGTPKDKTPVLALVDKATGDVRTRILTEVTGPSLRKALSEEIDLPATVMHTDGAATYKGMRSQFAGHEYVDHGGYEFVRGAVSTNQAESFFAQYKRSLDGTYHNVSKAHLGRYTDEFTFRWNTRRITDHSRMMAVVRGAAGRRLSYRPLTGR